MRRAVLAVVAFVLIGAVAGSIVHARTRDARSHAALAARLAIVDKLGQGEEQESAVSESARRSAKPGKPWTLQPRTFPARAARSFLASGAPTFGQPTIVGIQGVGFEEDIRIDLGRPDRVYASVPGSLSSDTSWIWRSLDGGRTFKWVTSSAPLTGKVVSCAGGGDTELAVDSTGSLYFNDLTLANFSTGRSDDGGVTWNCSNTGVPDTAVDRQWYATDGDPKNGGAIYLTNDEIGPGAVQCPGSTGNNVLVMYRSPLAGAGATAGVQFGPANKVTRDLSCDEGIMGNNELSPVATRTGKLAGGQPATLASPVKHVYDVPDDASYTKIAIGRCFPVAFGPPVANVSDPSGLNCDDLPVADLGAYGTVRTGGDFPTLAIDRAGNLYVVWEQAPVVNGQAGDTVLKYAYSTNEERTWSTPITVPTGDLHNNVFAWVAAGDDGRVGISWVGTPAHVDANGGPQGCGSGGPDAVNGSWGLYYTMTPAGHGSTVQFTAPQLASEHPIHRGSIQTVIGGQCGDRTLGDFFQLRVGATGEVQASYADSNNIDAPFAPHGMYVRQVGGAGLYATKGVSGNPIPVGSSTDVGGDGRYEAGGVTSANAPNLDIVGSSVTRPPATQCHPAGAACLRVQMTVANLSTAPAPAPDPDGVLVWQTQWLFPSAAGCTSSAPSCQNGGRNLFVYAESESGGSIRCFVGENAAQVVGGGVTLTYPGAEQLTATGACSAQTGPNGKITIDVPVSTVSLDAGVSPYANRLYSVTASTITAPQPPESVPSLGGIGGVFFDVLDVAPAYDVKL
jgi:hypothetical protein